MPRFKLIKYFIICVTHSFNGRNHFNNDCEKWTDEDLREITFALFIAIVVEMIALLLLLAIFLKPNEGNTAQTITAD